jgi:mannitol operon transcriptional antiterminator
MTHKLNQRQMYMLHLISENKNMSMDELVRRLEVSRRTIQRDISVIHGFLRGFGIVLDTAGNTIRLIGNSADMKRVFASFGKMPAAVALTAKDRAVYAMLELLLSDEPLKLSYLAKKLQVTSSSISSDLGLFADWLRGRKLKLIRQRGYGVEISGDEASRIEAIAEIIHQQLSVYQLMSVLSGQGSDENRHPVDVWLANWFSGDRMNEVRAVLSEELASLNPPLDEAAFYAFMLHVLLTCLRIETNHPLAQIAGSSGELPTEAKMCAGILRRLLPGEEKIDGEAIYLAKHLRGAKVQMTEDSKVLPLNITTMDLSFHLSQALSGTLRMPLSRDRELLFGLAQHLEPAIYRMRMGLSIRNPLLDEVKRRYPDYFVAMRKASDVVLKPYGLDVPDVEIGYLTMHLGAALERLKSGNVWRVKIVCPNGISSAELLASRIKSEFPQIHVVSVEAIQSLRDMDCDFVVSTVPIETHMRPNITVSPFLDEKDVTNIQRLIQELERTFSPMKQRYAEITGKSGQPEVQLVERISESVQVSTVDAKNVPELIQLIAGYVCEVGDSVDALLVAKAIEERERLGSIVLPGKRFAVLHARTAAMTRCHVSVHHLATPISMQGVGEAYEEVDSVLVLLARDDESPVVIELLGRLSAALVMDGSTLNTLRGAPITEIRQCIIRALNHKQE